VSIVDALTAPVADNLLRNRNLGRHDDAAATVTRADRSARGARAAGIARRNSFCQHPVFVTFIGKITRVLRVW
jgi:hypothetical protein